MASTTNLGGCESMTDLAQLLSSLAAGVALLVPAGLVLIAGGGLAGRRPGRSALFGLGALTLAATAYWACGFALQFGGARWAYDLPGLEGLVAEWSPVDVSWGLGWGALGLSGFFLLGDAATPQAAALFLCQLAPLAVAAAVPLLALRERAPGWVVFGTGLLTATLVYPVTGNWVLGGGWLANLGQNLGLGHGYVDATGLSMAALIGGVAASLGIALFGRKLPALPEDQLPRLPPVHLPVQAMLGAWIATVGAVALTMASPLFGVQGLSAPTTATNLALAAAGGALLPSLYTWFTTGRADALMASRGVAAALLAASGVAPFAPAWSMLALGALLGLVVPLFTYVLQYVVRVEDPTGALPVALLGGVLGALAPGFLADGRYGQGWNGVGPNAYLGVSGQGVTGYIPALPVPGPHLAADWPGQMNAQLMGLAAIGAWALIVIGALLVLCKVLVVAWRSIPPPPRESLKRTPETAFVAPQPMLRRAKPRAKSPARPIRPDRSDLSDTLPRET
jgi:Amt family ammonium transporter